MIAPLRRAPDDVLAAALEIDRVSGYHENKERHLREKDAKYGVVYTDETLTEMQSDADTAKAAMMRAMYWDTLRELDRETALLLVLRYCMGYSATEIAAGLGLTYAQVKYRTRSRSR